MTLANPTFWLPWLVLAAIAWFLWAFVAAKILRNPRGTADYGLGLAIASVYARGFHRLRIWGAENLPARNSRGPLIIVANHTSGIDPILIHASCRVDIRWMMARDMMAASLEWVWTWMRVIPVDREARDTRSLREAMKVLKAGGVVGIFPEGGLERPPRQLRPFHPGIGLLMARSGAKVLPMIIDDTPTIDPVWESLHVPSRSSLTCCPAFAYDPGRPPDELTRDLESYFARVTGWPLNTSQPPPPVQGGGLYSPRSL